MAFIDVLRSARESTGAVVHEFLTQYNPRSGRVYAFFEAQDDIAFFAPRIERRLERGATLLTYHCSGKPRVIKTFREIVKRLPTVKRALFFVDKDLDDVVGTPWPTDPRIYVTDLYSVENYLVTPDVFRRLLRDGLRLKGVGIDDETLVQHFEGALTEFQKHMVSIMAWILVARRLNRSPLMGNIRLESLCEVSEECHVRPRMGVRMKHLSRQTRVDLPTGAGARIRDAIKELDRLPRKRVIRGKFEAWFMTAYWRHLVRDMERMAREQGGACSSRISVQETTLVLVLSPYADDPESLEHFLDAHLGDTVDVGEAAARQGWPHPFLGRLIRRLLGG